MAVNDDEDRLSQLPDGVVSHILSYLSTKEAVATSILSSRYKSLYTSVPTIELNYEDLFFHRSLFPEQRTDSLQRVEQDFIGIVDKMLAMGSGYSLNKFSIAFYSDCGYLLPFLTWICCALKRDVEILDVRLGSNCGATGLLPSEICTTRTLVVLKLNLCSALEMRVPGSLDLPNLKVLHLNDLSWVSDNVSMVKVLASCSLLEELEINNCEFTGIDTLDISIPCLKKVCLSECYGIGEIIIDTPNLFSLLYSEELDKKIIMKNLNSLVRACIEIDIWGATQFEEVSSNAHLLMKSIAGMSNIELLVLRNGCIKALYLAGYTWPPFQKLTWLELEADPVHFYKLLPAILDSVPELESLFLRMRTEKDFLEDYVEYPGDERLLVSVQETETMFPSQHLKEVEIQNLTGCESDIPLVQYILQYGEVLEKITIFQKKNGFVGSIESFRKKLLMLPRSSRTCQLYFS